MKYTSEVFDIAQGKLEERRLTAISEANKRRIQVENDFPEIRRINEQLSNTLAEISLGMKSENVKESIDLIAERNLAAQKQLAFFLEAAGLGKDYLKPEFFCKKCHDTGFVNGKRCECFEELLKKTAISKLNEQCRVKLCSFEEFSLKYYEGKDKITMENVLNICKKYARSFSCNSDSLLFYGGTGLSKTFMSSAIASQVINNGFSVTYDSFSNYVRLLENERFGRSDTHTMSLLISADLVILDDVGSEQYSSFGEASLYEIINTRINYCLPTIVSTNLSFDELEKQYNERIYSRLCSTFIPIEFVGRDIRMQKRFGK